MPEASFYWRSLEERGAKHSKYAIEARRGGEDERRIRK